LAGVVVGGLLSYWVGAGIAGRQRRDSHRAAVRAVVYELTENIPKVRNPPAPGQLTTATYDSLVVPLYTDLPDQVAQQISLAYAMLHGAGKSIAALGPGQQTLIRDAVVAAQTSLTAYAQTTFRMRFPHP
jgi:hypothetical protein